MNKKVILSIGGVILLVGVAAIGVIIFGGKQATAPHSTTPTQTSGTEKEESSQDERAEDTESQSAVITLTDNGFSPSMLIVAKGTVVTVKNESSVSMQFSSDDHPTHRINQGMNLRVLAPGESDNFTAEKVGKWGFHCHLNAQHTGTLTVTE